MHVHANNYDRPCLQYYMQQRLSTYEFTSSLRLDDVQAVDRKQPSASQLSRPSASQLLSRPSWPDSDSSSSSDDDHAFLSNEVDTPSPSSCPMPRPVLKFTQKLTPFPDAAAYPSCHRDPIVPHGKPSNSPINHQKLDYFLFHQLLDPYIPSPLALKPPSYSVLAHLVRP